MKLSDISKSTKAKIGVTVFMFVIVTGSLLLANMMVHIVKPETGTTQKTNTAIPVQPPDKAPVTEDSSPTSE